MQSQRQRTGIARLDEALGGGLLPGTLTVVIGASGVGKSQLGVSWANAGKVAEERRGAIVDFSSRGDPQNHAEYARRLSDWEISPQPMSRLDPPIYSPAIAHLPTASPFLDMAESESFEANSTSTSGMLGKASSIIKRPS